MLSAELLVVFNTVPVVALQQGNMRKALQLTEELIELGEQ